MSKTLITDTITNENTNEIIIKKKINRSKNIKNIDKEITLMINETENINLNKEEKDLSEKNTKEEKHKKNKSKINKSPKNLFIDITQKYKNKEETITIWDDSEFKSFTTLTSNNRGNVGEDFINELCSMCNIKGEICGTSFKGMGKDGDIKEKSIEIKTAYFGNSGTFQHELGEEPWKSEYMIFIDVSPTIIYLTIFKNFDEKKYKSKETLSPYFPTKTITWRKNKGAFKLDTSEKINEESVKNGYSIKITNEIKNEEIKKFLNKSIE